MCLIATSVRQQIAQKMLAVGHSETVMVLLQTKNSLPLSSTYGTQMFALLSRLLDCFLLSLVSGVMKFFFWHDNFEYNREQWTLLMKLPHLSV